MPDYKQMLFDRLGSKCQNPGCTSGNPTDKRVLVFKLAAGGGQNVRRSTGAAAKERFTMSCSSTRHRRYWLISGEPGTVLVVCRNCQAIMESEAKGKKNGG